MDQDTASKEKRAKWIDRVRAKDADTPDERKRVKDKGKGREVVYRYNAERDEEDEDEPGPATLRDPRKAPKTEVKRHEPKRRLRVDLVMPKWEVGDVLCILIAYMRTNYHMPIYDICSMTLILLDRLHHELYW